MVNQLVSCPGIFFRLCEPYTSQIISWRRDVDEAVMRYQLGRSPKISVIGLQGQGWIHISEMPEQGEFIPFYGDTGGGFEFIFHPAGGQTDLKVEATFSGHPMFHPDPIEPLKLTAPNMFLSLAEVYPNVGTTGPDDALPDASEFLFGFYNDIMDMYRKWEWYDEDLEKFEFSFAPTSIGVMALVRYRENSALLDLTRDLNW